MPANQSENQPEVPEEPQTVDPEWRTKLVEALAKIPEEREKHIEELEALLPSLNTFDLLGWVSLRNLLIDPEKYREGENGGMALRVEYLTLLSLVRGFNEGTGAMPNLNDLQVVGDLTDKICSSKALEAMQLRLARPMEGAEAELADLANAAYLNELFVRVPGFPHHHEAVIRGLFKPFDAELRRDLGFGPEEAITLAHALKVRLQRVFDARMDAARSSASRLEKFAKLRRRGKVPEMAGVPDELLLSYARLSDRGLRRAARGMTRTVEMATMGDLLAFSLEDLSTEAGVSAEATKRFLEAFTLDFQAVDPKYRYPEVLHPLKHKPLIRHGKRHFAPIPDQLLWAFQPLFERTLLNTPLRQRFNSHRHDWLLEEGCRLLTRIMPRIQLDTNLRYPKPKGVQGDVAELDALGRYDSALFFIEAKGASLRDKGKQGTPHVFRDEIEKILEAAHEQAFRAYEHAVGGGEFVRSDGTRMSAVLGGTTRVFLIALTLEPLGFLTARMDARNPFSASSNHGLLAVNVHDLMAMADCLDGYPAWFPHYLTRRGRLAQQGFLSAAEELDLFCYYMERGLYHKGPQDFGDADQVTLGTWTDKLDELYLADDLRTVPVVLG
jgi:hypothetical protein